MRFALFLSFAAIALYFMWGQFRELFVKSSELASIRFEWFLVMIFAEVLSFACLWWLTKLTLPKTSWFVVATTQLVSNAVSRVVPGGAATGGAILYRMLASAGVKPQRAAGALSATSILTTAALVAIPAVSGLLALLGAPVPEALFPVAIAGFFMFILLLGVGLVTTMYTKPLVIVSEMLGKAFRFVGSKINRPWDVSVNNVLNERDRLKSLLGDKLTQAILASAGKWAFDYLTLVFALYAVGASPRLSVVLLAYAGAAVLAMVPITPGGFGFVEIGLPIMLTWASVSSGDAALAMIAYRLVSLWFPVLCGVFAWFATFGESFEGADSQRELIIDLRSNPEIDVSEHELEKQHVMVS